MTGQWAVAEEIAQEALCEAHRRWDSVATMDRPDLWLRRVATNRAISLHRRAVTEAAALVRLRGSAAPANGEVPDPTTWRAVRRLPRRQAAALVLWAVEGRPMREVGEILGCSEETARTHLRRARARLTDELGGDNDG